MFQARNKTFRRSTKPQKQFIKSKYSTLVEQRCAFNNFIIQETISSDSSEKAFIFSAIPWETYIVESIIPKVAPPNGNHLFAVRGTYPPRSFNQSASTRRAQLSIAAKAARPTDLLNHVKSWANTEPFLVKAPLSV